MKGEAEPTAQVSTIVGTQLFPIRIDSQKWATTTLDWRVDQFKDMYEFASIDNGVADALLKLHNDLGLCYAAYDLILDTSGEFVFLECNPAGQWLWMGDDIGRQIADAIATALVTEARAPKKTAKSKKQR